MSIEKLMKVKEEIENTRKRPLVTNALRQEWGRQLGEVVDQLRGEDDEGDEGNEGYEDAEDAEDDEDDEDDEDGGWESDLSDHAVELLSDALNRPAHVVATDPDGAIEDVCAARGACSLSEHAVDLIATALGRPRWQVEENQEQAIDDLCRKLRK